MAMEMNHDGASLALSMVPIRTDRTARERSRLCMLQALGLILYPFRLSPRSPFPDPCSILIIRPDHLGDLLFLSPALHWLREALPEARITLLAGPWGQELMERCPYVDEVLTCSFPGFTRGPKGALVAPYHLLQLEARRLRQWHFDLALVMRFDHWWGALLAEAAGIPRRIGYATPEVRPFLTHAEPYEVGKHEVEQNLRLVSSIRRLLPHVAQPGEGWEAHRLEFAPTSREEKWARYWPEQQGIEDDRSLVAVHPGAGAAVKLWEPDKWALLVDQLTERRAVQVVLTGSTGELDLAWAVAARARTDPLVAAGRTELGQLAALYSRCRLVIGPDCGPLHLAVAVGTPTLHLYGPADARSFGPWGDPFRHRTVVGTWPCIPCNCLDFSAEELPAHGCVREIAVDRVLSEAESLLAGRW